GLADQVPRQRALPSALAAARRTWRSLQDRTGGARSLCWGNTRPLTDPKQQDVVGIELGERPRGEGVRGGERRGEIPGAPGAANQGEAVVTTPAQYHAPGDGAAIGAAEQQRRVEVVEDRVAADQGAVVERELGGEHGVQGADALRDIAGVVGAFAGVGAATGHQARGAWGARAVRAAVAAARRSWCAVSASPRAVARAACAHSTRAQAS